MPASKPCPIAVSDAQMNAILTAAAPLQPVERSVFLASLANEQIFASFNFVDFRGDDFTKPPNWNPTPST